MHMHARSTRGEVSLNTLLGSQTCKYEVVVTTMVLNVRTIIFHKATFLT